MDGIDGYGAFLFVMVWIHHIAPVMVIILGTWLKDYGAGG